PLMIAAENGHTDAVKLLLEIGASRYSTDEEGKSAATLAEEAGHTGIASLINHEPSPDEFALESPEAISGEMDEYVAAAEGVEPAAGEPGAEAGLDAADGPAGSPAAPEGSAGPSRPIEGAVLGGVAGSPGSTGRATTAVAGGGG